MHEQPFPVIDLEATGKNILRLRREKGLTVRDMQGYFHFEEPRAIYKWQSGQSLPTVDNLYALSILLNVSMDAIIVGRSATGNTAKPQDIPAASYFTLSSIAVFVIFAWPESPLLLIAAASGQAHIICHQR